MIRKIFLISLMLIIASTFVSAQKTSQRKEFRGVWIATVNNTDWPLRPAMTPDEQRESFRNLLTIHQRTGINAVIVQIRPAADAFYKSAIEPWSQWLTGVQGRAPDPLYDPLEFMINEAHERGMEFHAWFNPYRAISANGVSSVAPDHITKQKPDWFIRFGGRTYFDPGNKDAQDYVVNIVSDVVRRYKIDGVHFDDYFYPYPAAGQTFNDRASFQKHGTGLTLAGWRRSNTDSIIAKTSRAVHAIKPKCRFGVSPFGIWRNQARDADGSASNGLAAFDDLHADVLSWLKNGWLDYVAPQLYWEIGYKRAPFEVMTEWWSRHTYGKDLYIGIAYYRANSNTAWKDKTQLPRQIRVSRATPNVSGMIFYSSKAFERNPNGWNDSLRLNYFNLTP